MCDVHHYSEDILGYLTVLFCLHQLYLLEYDVNDCQSVNSVNTMRDELMNHIRLMVRAHTTPMQYIAMYDVSQIRITYAVPNLHIISKDSANA